MLHCITYQTVTTVSKNCIASETQVTIFQSAWCNIPENLHLQQEFAFASMTTKASLLSSKTRCPSMPGTMPYQDAITQFANQGKLPHYF